MASTSVDNVDREGFVANRPSSGPPGTVCPHFRALVELVGRRWSGAILVTLLDGPQFFRDLGSAVPGI